MFSKKPVIAAISGYAVAGGLELSLLCDLRICDQSSIFGVYCRRWGVPLIDGGTVRLPQLIGLSRALDMILTGRSVNADEALSFGLVNRVVSNGTCLQHAVELAEQLCQYPQQCMNIDRNSAYNSTYTAKSLTDALTYEYQHGAPIVQLESIAGATRFSQQKVGRGGDFSFFMNKTAANINNSATIISHNMSGTSSSGKVRCIFFDLGGVVFGSPVHAIIKYEKSLGYHNYEINKLMAASQHWLQLETGQIALPEFYKLFQLELNSLGHTNADIKHIFQLMNTAISMRNEMKHTLITLRSAGYIVGAITNNWYSNPGDSSGSNASILSQYFDIIIESCVTGYRKPDRMIFDIACKRANVQPSECIFLDDIGRNLIGAQQLGFITIKVNIDYIDAIKQLQYVLDQQGIYRVELGFGRTDKPKKQSKL